MGVLAKTHTAGGGTHTTGVVGDFFNAAGALAVAVDGRGSVGS
jgi:hypothetical protein